MDRRRFLVLSGAAGAAALARGRVAFATTPGEARFVFVFLRGGLDGLHALVPHADADYRRLRPGLALTGEAVRDLDGYFGLNAALDPLLPLWHAGELAFVPAAATRYRDRSHFDGQNLLENGTGQPFGARDGWLNRAIAGLTGGDRRLGLSLGTTVPLILQGAAPIQAWTNETIPDPSEDFLNRIARLYADDPQFDAAYRAARNGVQPEMDMMDMAGVNGRPGAGGEFILAARAAGALLAHPRGPRIAVMDLTGWDTHVNQAGRLTNRLGILARGMTALRDALGADWSRTVVMVGSEFGRTAAENGAGGTDHGTGGLAILAGGAVAGGRVLGDWPGLGARDLFEGRDVQALNAYEGIFKAVLSDHLGLDRAYLDRVVFPGAEGIAPAPGLFRPV
ncbi:MAG: DUF1501 domain-containing protein [Pararhodobacter sp.]